MSNYYSSTNHKMTGRPSTSCSICSMDPILIPYQTQCGHLYCYVCLRNAIVEAGAMKYRCQMCGAKITSSQPFKSKET